MGILYVCSFINVLLFFYGFFPISAPEYHKNNIPPRSMDNVAFEPIIYESNISKTVLIVIDALRLDFVNSLYMPSTTKLTNAKGCFSRVRVHSPTVTLPRIKALTSGFVPQFIDVVLNIASVNGIQDSIIHSFAKNNKRVIFYGDETWLKLFPNLFTRSEGTHSFFVNDFTEVDDNVTRNANIELERNDWDLMILHYLGLDHIGHVHGPFSPRIPEKLQEMDNIIQKINMDLSKRYKEHLIIVTGDHGMRDGGGHGGSTFAEINVPLLIIGMQCQNGSLLQTDIPVNLAVLHGIHIPSTATGELRKNLLPFNMEKYLFILRYNLMILMRKSSLCTTEFGMATYNHLKYLQSKDDWSSRQAAGIYENCSTLIVSELLEKSVEQNIMILVLSMGSMAITIIFFLKNLIPKFVNFRWKSHTGILILCVFFTFIHPLTYFSTSYIEEEHQFWYFAVNFISIFISLTYFNKKSDFLYGFFVAGIIRFLRNLNSTGNQWVHLPDISDWLSKEDNVFICQVFHMSSLVFLFIVQKYYWCKNSSESLLIIPILMLIFMLKVMYDDNIGKIIWLLIAIHYVIFHKTSKLTTWCLIITLLLKPYNVILVPFCLLVSRYYRREIPPYLILILHIWLGNVLFFSQGHSNSLASVDISIGYIGLNDYNPVLVMIQVLCHTYAFPILCHLLIFDIWKEYNLSNGLAWSMIFMSRTYIMIVVCTVSLLNREHLFIWSVFAPKLFIETCNLSILFFEFCLFSLYKKVSINKLLDYIFYYKNKTNLIQLTTGSIRGRN